MVANYTKETLSSLLLTLLLVGHSIAAEYTNDQGTSELARNNFLRLITIMNETVQTCDRKAEIIDIPHWKQLGTTRESLLLGVSYHNLRSNNQCMAQAAKDLLMAVKMLEISGIPDWEKGPSVKFVDMILDSWWKELEAESKYRSQVSAANQEKIDGIFRLQLPFKIIQSWNASGN
jgi:hypothetical protein